MGTARRPQLPSRWGSPYGHLDQVARMARRVSVSVPPPSRTAHTENSSRLVATAVDIGTDACSRIGCLSILVMCWSCGRIASAAAGTSTRRPQTCLSAFTSAPGAATARRTSCTGSVRTAAASSSGAPSARPTCSQSTHHRPSGLSGQDALRHPPADPPIGEQEPTAPSPPDNGASGRPLPSSAYRRPRRILRSFDHRRASRRGRPCVSGGLDLRCPPPAAPAHAQPPASAPQTRSAGGGFRPVLRGSA
jgi:hypothetical protein